MFLCCALQKYLGDVLTTHFDANVFCETCGSNSQGKVKCIQFLLFLEGKLVKVPLLGEKCLLSELLGGLRISFERFSESWDSSESDVGNIHQVFPLIQFLSF